MVSKFSKSSYRVTFSNRSSPSPPGSSKLAPRIPPSCLYHSASRRLGRPPHCSTQRRSSSWSVVSLALLIGLLLRNGRPMGFDLHATNERSSSDSPQQDETAISFTFNCEAKFPHVAAVRKRLPSTCHVRSMVPCRRSVRRGPGSSRFQTGLSREATRPARATLQRLVVCV